MVELLYRIVTECTGLGWDSCLDRHNHMPSIYLVIKRTQTHGVDNPHTKNMSHRLYTETTEILSEQKDIVFMKKNQNILCLIDIAESLLQNITGIQREKNEKVP